MFHISFCMFSYRLMSTPTFIEQSPHSFIITQCIVQGLHRLEKYLNIQDCLDKSLKIKFALKVLEKHSKALKSP